MRKLVLAAAFTVATITASAAQAAYTLTNPDGTDGAVGPGPAPFTFTLISGNNGVAGTTLYSNVATGRRTVFGTFLYMTGDDGGARFDPGGYFVNSIFTQLSDDSLPDQGRNSGRFSFNVVTGDVFGFYMSTTGSTSGIGILSILSVPEPATWALMVGGFGATGLVMRRRRTIVAA